MSAFKRLKHTLSNLYRNLIYLYRNLIYLSQQDYKKGLALMLEHGKRLEYNAPSDLRHCPLCERELTRTMQQGFVISFCQWCYQHPQDVTEAPDVERQSDKLPVAVLNLPPGEWSRRWNSSDKHTQQVQVPPKS